MIDLHVHSCRSDGTDTPRRLVELAAEAQCDLFALTDHDTLSGYAEAQAAGKELGVEVICGTELSCHHGSRAVHLLAYFFRKPGPAFESFLQVRRDQRDRRNEHLAQVLQEQGIDITIQDVLAAARGEAVGRPHFAAVLIERGYADSVEDAFARFLGSNVPFFASRRDLPVAEAIQAVKAAGGVTAWAHPLMNTESIDEIKGDLEEMTALGLDGLESWYSSYLPDERQKLANMARNHGLIPTGGSDYHGKFKPGLSIARGKGDLKIPNSVAEELRSAAR